MKHFVYLCKFIKNQKALNRKIKKTCERKIEQH